MNTVATVPRTFGENFVLAFRHYSTYVFLAFTSSVAWYLAQPEQIQAAWQLDYPLLKYVAPASAIISFFVAKSTPQTPPKDAP